MAFASSFRSGANDAPRPVEVDLARRHRSGSAFHAERADIDVGQDDCYQQDAGNPVDLIQNWLAARLRKGLEERMDTQD